MNKWHTALAALVHEAADAYEEQYRPGCGCATHYLAVTSRIAALLRTIPDGELGDAVQWIIGITYSETPKEAL